MRADTEWAQALGVDRRTVGVWRRELRGLLEKGLRGGINVMESELRERGLIPDN